MRGGNSSPSVTVTSIVAPRRQVCREGCSSARVGFDCPHLSSPISLPSAPPRLPSCGVCPRQHLQTHHHHMLPSLIPLQHPRSADTVVGGEAGGGVSEGRGQRRMEEVVRWNSGHNAAGCKYSSIQHRAGGKRTGWFLGAAKETSAFPRADVIYLQP